MRFHSSISWESETGGEIFKAVPSFERSAVDRLFLADLVCRKIWAWAQSVGVDSEPVLLPLSRHHERMSSGAQMRTQDVKDKKRPSSGGLTIPLFLAIFAQDAAT